MKTKLMMVKIYPKKKLSVEYVSLNYVKVEKL